MSGALARLTPPAHNFLMRNATGVAIATVTFLLVFAALVYYRQTAANTVTKDWVVHTYEVKEHIQTLLNQFEDAQVGQRGYILTGDIRYLEPYITAIANAEGQGPSDSIRDEQKVLRQITADNPVQQNNLTDMDHTLTQLMAFLAATVDLRKTEGAEAILQKTDFYHGKELMDRLRRLDKAMTAEEDRLLAVRMQTYDAGTRRNQSFTFFGIAIFYLVTVLAVRLCRKAEKAAQAQLAQNAAYLGTVMNTIVDGLIVSDDQGAVQSINPAAERMFGYKPDEILGRNVKMLMPELGPGAHAGRETAGRRKDGSTFPAELGVSEMQIEDKRLFSGIVRDIGERKEAERATRLLAAIVESSEEAIIGKSLDGFVTSWNAGAERLLGYKAAEIVGQPVSLLVPPEQADEERHIMAELRQGRRVQGLETQRLAKGGAVIDVLVTLSPIRDAAGKVIGISTVTHDIRARKKAELEIQRHMQALKQSNQELDDFAYIASHDLKEPLRGLVSNAMFLKEDFADKLDDGTVKRLDRMTYLCQRMEKLMDDLLYFSRLGRQQLAVQRTDLNEIIKDIKLAMETTLQEANVSIVVPAPLPTIVCDLPRVTEVFRNLISNAVKYNKSAEKRIEIGCVDAKKIPAGNDNNNGAAFYVRDNGVGIPKQFYDDIFRIFKRLNEEDDRSKGTGVGLTFVRKIVERHGGRIWLDSEPGRGTTFYFTLNSGTEKRS